MKGRRLLNRREALQIAGLSMLGQAAVGVAAATGVSRQANPQRSGIAPSNDRVHGATPTGVQDFVDQAPADVFAGPPCYERAGGVSRHRWIMDRVYSPVSRGNFIYVITRLGTEPGTLPRVAGTPNASPDTMSLRDMPWTAIQAGSKLVYDRDPEGVPSGPNDLSRLFAMPIEIVRK
jgi:hypothetical protein